MTLYSYEIARREGEIRPNEESFEYLTSKPAEGKPYVHHKILLYLGER